MQIGSHSAALIHLQAPAFSDHRHESHSQRNGQVTIFHLTPIFPSSALFSTRNGRLKAVSGGHSVKPRRAPRGGGTADAPAASVPNALCGAPRNAANWAGARFAGTTAIDSDPPDQLDGMDADDLETEDGVGSGGYTPGPSGVAEASNNAHLRPPIPHTPWYQVVNARRRKVVAEEASATPPAPFHERERRHGTGWPRLPRLPAEDHNVVFHIRGGISLDQEAVLPLRAAIQTALRAPLHLEARIRVRKEQNIALISTSDPDLAEQLCHVQTLELGSRSYEVSAYVASPDNSCKGVITGALPIPTEDALMNDTVTYPQRINIIQARAFGTNGACLYTFEGRRVPRYVYFQGVEFRCRPFRPVTQVCHCCLRTGHRHDICPYRQERRCGNYGVLNPDEHHDGCVPRCLTCGSDEHPTIDLGCPARQRRPGPRALRDGRQLPEKPNTPQLRKNTEELPPHIQPRSSSQNTDSQGPTRTARSKRPKIPNQGQQTSQPIPPQVPPPTQTPAHPSRNHPTPSSECGAKSNATWPALPQRQSTHAPGLAARAAAPSASGSSTGGHLNQVLQSQLQRRQDPLADSGKSPV
ncbi:hypothetical protein HPB52_024765 [Rhipicephalus sanguineus]|uniref:Gag-like protein n=1 Tax=Rhipicephalus sanguineus TaxID=34632 RepID=A0A9D4PBL4_RHISA|nr:hypothetical protein HPB52_024765 [Rhipicephalus sanguineus]